MEFNKTDSDKVNFEEIFNSAPNAYLILSVPDFTIEAVNNAYLNATKQKKEEMIGKYTFDVFPQNPNELDGRLNKVLHSLERTVETGSTQLMAITKYDVPLNDGKFEERYWRLTNCPVVKDNKVKYVIHNAENITDYVKTKQQLDKKDSEIFTHMKQMQDHIDRTYCIINSTSDLIVAIDTKFSIQIFNDAFSNYYLRRFQQKVINGYTIDEKQESWKCALNGEKIVITDEYDDSFFELHYNAIYDSDNNIIGACMIGRDITEHLIAKNKAEEANKLKTIFFSNISHEFRTPLTLILAPLEDMIQNNGSNYEIELIYKNTHRLLKLVNSLLDFSRLENNRVKPIYENINITQLTTDLCSIFRSTVEKAKLKFILNLKETIYANIDKEMWEKIIFNLLSNALKFTFDGYIEVSLKVKFNNIKLTVNDSGVGIPEHALLHLFERFYRVEESKCRSFEGTGIGLALCKELIKLHNGNITVKSKINVGTKIIVKIPINNDDTYARRESYEIGKIGASFINETNTWLNNQTQCYSHSENHLHLHLDQKNYKILLVDDNADMREYIKGLLAQYWIVDTAENGKIAIDLALTNNYDLIITDIMMPIMNGFQLLKTLRENSKTQIIPVIMLSARSGNEEKIEGLQQGASDYLVKPFNAKELIARANTQLELNSMRIKLAQESARLAEANNYKIKLEEIIDTICHEIRNPINGIIGNIELIKELTNYNLLKENLDIIEQCTNYQKSIVDNVLEISRLDAKKDEIVNVNFFPKDVIKCVVKMFSTQITQKQLEIIYDDPDSNLNDDKSNIEIISDVNKLKTIMMNLIGNAIKFTHTYGKIIIDIKQIDKNEIVFKVSDNGIGISENDQEKLFDRFFQGKYNTGNNYEGTGLGLTITKKFINLLGGDISVKSKIDKGSEFTFNIKCTIITKFINPENKNMFLIVEDNIINQKIIASCIKSMNYQYMIANNGSEALEKINDNSNFDFKLIFMDIKMPLMDGLDTTKAIRDRENNLGLKRIPIIGVSADTRSDRIEIALQTGMDDYITKPYKKETVVNIIKKYLQHNDE
jgi:signal transduction histidine kinase